MQQQHTHATHLNITNVLIPYKFYVLFLFIFLIWILCLFYRRCCCCCFWRNVHTYPHSSTSERSPSKRLQWIDFVCVFPPPSLAIRIKTSYKLYHFLFEATQRWRKEDRMNLGVSLQTITTTRRTPAFSVIFIWFLLVPPPFLPLFLYSENTKIKRNNTISNMC